jgi:hypothetical protein
LLENVTTRPLDQTAGRVVQDVGQSVQAADHGAEGVEAATAIEVKRTPMTKLFVSGLRILQGLKVITGTGPDLAAQAKFQTRESTLQISIFHQGVVAKTGPAAIVLTALAHKTVMTGHRVVSRIHLLIDGCDPIEAIRLFSG